MPEMCWLILFIVLLIIEIITLGLTTIWFAGGAIVAFISAMLGAGLPIQVTLFFVVSLALLFATRPIAIKYINRNRTKTNADSLVGKTAIVLEDINNIKAQGLVSVQGQEWTARTLNDESTVAKDKLVIIRGISGVKLMVEEKREEDK